ncbi:hypothetical protein BDN72DRAFT_861108 [Pluteus cervinus]|uniref:Uncharacterized protein n=1 Tax=Pluteus cervinus TaxID=181527 RepID=A0ACD3AFY9_9AGAR|nr:hypothetical protein BDN72DRAFT_861108 [Pluteus cervinus]
MWNISMGFGKLDASRRLTKSKLEITRHSFFHRSHSGISCIISQSRGRVSDGQGHVDLNDTNSRYKADDEIKTVDPRHRLTSINGLKDGCTLPPKTRPIPETAPTPKAQSTTHNEKPPSPLPVPKTPHPQTPEYAPICFETPNGDEESTERFNPLTITMSTDEGFQYQIRARRWQANGQSRHVYFAARMLQAAIRFNFRPFWNHFGEGDWVIIITHPRLHCSGDPTWHLSYRVYHEGDQFSHSTIHLYQNLDVSILDHNPRRWIHDTQRIPKHRR